MADNTRLNTGVGGDLIRTDDISGVKIPTSKISLGADNADDGFVSASNPLPVNDKPVGSFVTGQISVGLSAVQMPSNAATKGVLIVADEGNNGTVYIGTSAGVTSGNSIKLFPGTAVTIPVSNSNLVYCLASLASQTISFTVV